MKQVALVSVVLALGASCARGPAEESRAETFVLASTTSTQDSGLLDALVPAFEKVAPRYRAKVVAVGSGEAMDLGRRGDADVLLVHSPDDERKFMDEGLGLFRKAVMRNDFVIAGPSQDPGPIRSSANAEQAFLRIAQSRSLFVSRGDESGTHERELKTWGAAGLSPSGSWYLESGQGMAETLTIASERGCYVLTDTATFTVMKNKVNLEILFSGDSKLINPYSVILAKRARRLDAGVAFAEWITGTAGQRFIGEFGRGEYGEPLFVPAR